MGEWIKRVPNWLLVTLLSLVVLVIVMCFVVAILDGRRVDMGSFSIHARNSTQVVHLQNEVERLNSQLVQNQAHLSESDVVALFPEDLRAKTLALTLTNINLQQQALDQQKTLIHDLEQKLEEVERVQGSFLYKLLMFNQEAACYGSTLNFTAGKDRLECLPKSQLAERFLEFLSEIDFYQATEPATTEQAKRQLLRLQEKYQFNTKGWYGPDVFKSIISEFYGKG